MPSYRTDSALDAQVKEGLITNTLELLNVSQNDRQRYLLRSALQSQIRLYGELFDSSDSERGKRRMLQALPEDVEKQWGSYLRNEAKFRGDFDLVLPANESELQPT